MQKKHRLPKVLVLMTLLCALFATCSFATKIRASETLNVRKAPSTGASILTRMPKGTVRTVKGSTGNWYKVVMNNKTGYVSKDYAKVVTAGAPYAYSVTYDLQTNYPNVPYRTKAGTPKGATIYSSGCCPVSLGNILRAKGISAATSRTMCALGTSSGARIGSGTVASTLLSAAHRKWGRFSYSYTTSTTSMRKAVANGAMALAHTKGSSGGDSGLFSGSGHFVAIVNANGKTLKVVDPYWYSGKWTATALRRNNITTTGTRGVVFTSSYAVMDACDYYYIIK